MNIETLHKLINGIPNRDFKLNRNKRVDLYSIAGTSTVDDNELLRLHATDYIDTKASIAYFIDKFNNIDFTSSNINTSTGIITITSHGFDAVGIEGTPTTNQPIKFISTGILPVPLQSDIIYYMRVIDANTIKIYNTLDNCQNNGTTGLIIPIDGGTGTHTIQPYYSQVWLVAHKYIHEYSPKTFLPANVNTTSDTITISGHNLIKNPWKCQFSSTGILPGGLSTNTDYYVNWSSTIFKVYDTEANAKANSSTGLINFTDGGTGTHTMTPDLDYGNNRHQHFSIEVTDNTKTAKQTRLSIPYGYNVCEMSLTSSNLNILSDLASNGKIRLVGGSSGAGNNVNKQIMFGLSNSNNLTPDETNIRWAIRSDNTAETGSNSGSDFKIVQYTDTGVANNNAIAIQRSTANVAIKDTPANATAPLTVNGDTIRLKTAKTPASATATGNAGDICWDANYVYVCVAANTWKRAALATW